MEAKDFKKYGADLLHYVTSYLHNLRSRPPFPDVRPGFLQGLIPNRAPQSGEGWEDVLKDVETVLMPGVRNYAKGADVRGRHTC